MTVLLLALCIMCFMAAFLEWVCLRDPTIPDNVISCAGRRVRIAGWMILGGRIAWLAFEMPHQPPNGAAMVALAMLSLSDIVRCANRLHISPSLNPTVVEMMRGNPIRKGQ